MYDKEFEQLIENRKKLLECMNINNFLEGLKSTLTDLYPFKAHFIYELLQNAEDMCATVVRFTLSDKQLEFEHNGTKRDFNVGDIDGITNIRNNKQKRDEPTNIGKFGIGFKAVYAYTDTPEIHSGQYHFRISEYFVPDVDGIEHRDTQGRTLFVFPLGTQKKSPTMAFSEIKEGLINIDSNSLLFLRHIERIEYVLPGEKQGYVHRRDNGNYFSIVIKHFDRVEQVSNWLRYEKPDCPISEEGIVRNCTVSVAYRLGFDSRSPNRPMIEPVDGRVYIYFPAEKETSNLRFHINAPFASTVARDSVRDCYENRELLEHIAQLVSNSMNDIKQRKMLDASFLGILPNPNDTTEQTKMYQVIQTYLVDAFKTKTYTPTMEHGHEAANNLLHAQNRLIATVFDNSTINKVTGTTKKWVVNVMDYTDPARFLKSLDIENYGYDQVLSLFCEYETRKKIEELVPNKDDKWLKKLYALLYLSFVNTRFLSKKEEFLKSIKYLKILRSPQGYISPDDNVYLLPINTIAASSEAKVIIRETYDGNDEDSRNAERFLRDTLCINDYSPSADFEIKLRYYSSNLFQSPDEGYFKFIMDCARFNKINPTNIFKNYSFLFFEEQGELHKALPERLALCKPYLKSGIDSIVSIIKKKPLWHGYYKHYDEGERYMFVNFLKDIGVFSKLSITRTNIENNPLFHTQLHSDAKKGNETKIDYSIDRLEDLLALRSFAVSKLIWDAIATHKFGYHENVLIAQYSPNNRIATKKCRSTLLHLLSNNEWLPDKAMKLHKPADISASMLHKQFQYDPENKILRELGIGRNRTIQCNKASAFAVELGFEKGSPEEQLIEAVASGKIPKDMASSMLSLLNQGETGRDTISPLEAYENATVDQKNPRNRSDGISSISDRERRIMKMEKEFEAGLNNTKNISRTLKYTYLLASKEEKREMLEHYNGRCQICNSFIIKHNGERFFLAINIVRTDKLDTKFMPTNYLGWNTLCLCPTCAAEYKYCSKDISAVPEQVEAIVVQERSNALIPITIKLSGKERKIFFAPKHLLALQVGLKKSEEICSG